MESYLSQSYINNTEDSGFYNLNSLSEIFYASLYGKFPMQQNNMIVGTYGLLFILAVVIAMFLL